MDGQQEDIKGAVQMAAQQIQGVMQAMRGVLGGPTSQATLSKDRQVSIYLRMTPEQKQRLRSKVGLAEFERYESEMMRLQVEGY